MSINPIITFDKDVFFPGEEITGKIKLKLTKDQSARKIEIKFLNETVVGWTKDGKPVSSCSSAKATETHLQVAHEVWTAEDDQNILPAGEYEWNFSFELPKDCQPTFESPLGYIRYVVSIHVDVPHFVDEARERAVTVATQLNINDIPNITEPVKLTTKEDMIGCDFISFLKKGSVQFSIQAPKTGYVAGETIHVKGLIENRLKANVKSIRGALVRKTVTKADDDNKGSKRKANAERLDRVLFGVVEELIEIPIGADHEFSFDITIPSVAPTIRNNSLIHVEYAIQIAAIPASKCIVDAIGEVPIVIGTVPIGGGNHGELVYTPSARGDLDTKCLAERMARNDTQFVPRYPVFKNL